jgi:hypothetical protein
MRDLHWRGCSLVAYPAARRSMLALVLLNRKHRGFSFRSVVCVVIVSSAFGGLVAGCGAGYTKADFIQRADGICTGTTRAARLLKPPQFTATTQVQRRSSAAYFRSVAAVVKRESQRLSALPVPPGSAAQRRLRVRWLAATHDSASELLALGQATAAGDTSAVTAANVKLAANPVVKLAAQYGAHACAGPGATYK